MTNKKVFKGSNGFCKYGFLCGILLLLISNQSIASQREVFTVKEVGISMNTNTVFVITNETATDSFCVSKDYFRIETPAVEAYLIYSAALNAMNHGKKLRIQYSTDACVANSQKIEVIWNMN